MTALATAAVRDKVDAIVIGASAGGVEALTVLLSALPAGLPAPIFIVLHLPRERPSLLVDIFRHRCKLAVKEAEDKEPVAPSTVYFAPPDYHLLIDKDADGRPQVALSSDEMVNYSRPSIDVLFESAAEVYGGRLLGIVLTGGNQDGAAGLAAIHAQGGIAVVQDPATAATSAMPAAALKSTEHAFVMPLEHIPGLIQSISTSIATPAVAPRG